MAKRKKVQIQMIDLSPRLYVEVVPSTEEEKQQTDKELHDLNSRIIKAMKEYEDNFPNKVSSILKNQSKVEVLDSTHYIEKYKKELENRDSGHVQQKIQKIKQYEDYLSKSNSNN